MCIGRMHRSRAGFATINCRLAYILAKPTPTSMICPTYLLSPKLFPDACKKTSLQTLSCGNTYHFAATFVDLLQAT